MISSQETVQFLESVQSTLNLLQREWRIHITENAGSVKKRVTALETEIDNLEKLCPRPVTEKLKGNSSLAAEIDIARTVARRAECSLAQVSVNSERDAGSRKFLNRLSDYFFILARYTENVEGKAGSYEMQKTEIEVTGAKAEAKNIKTQNTEAEAVNTMDTLAGTVNINEAVIREVLKRIGVQTRITLDIAKKLIDRIEQEALTKRGTCSNFCMQMQKGIRLAVHDDGRSISGKLRCCNEESLYSGSSKNVNHGIGKMAQAGGTFYGADKLDNGKIVIFGGGVPLKSGDTVIGGLGISGGTGEEDHSLAEYGQSVLQELI